MRYCSCLDVRSPLNAVADIRDELIELLADPSLDELSDVLFGVGRLIGAITGRVYVPIPGDRRHIVKIGRRMAEHGCIRSRRQMVEHT